MEPPPSVDVKTPDIGVLGENFVEHVCQIAFIEDFVFRRPKYRRGVQEKELCDVLVLFDDACLLIEVKTADPKAHQGWTTEEEIHWATNQTKSARKQLEGAFKALSKSLVPEVANRFQGRVDLRTNPPKRFFAIAAIDRPSVNHRGHWPSLEHGDARCPFIHLSFNELSLMLHELASVPDLLDYIEFRERFLERSTFDGCRELDLLAAFKTQFPSLDASIRSGNRVVLADDIWSKYAAMSRRQTRDKERWPSQLIDLIIRDMRNGIPVEENSPGPSSANPPGHTMLPGALYVATRVNSLRRIERVDIGNKLVEKSKLCESSSRGRFFAQRAHNGWLYVFYISNEDRPTRRQRLNMLTELAQIQYPTRQAVGIAMNSFTQPDIDMAIDSVVREFPEDFDWSTIPESDKVLAAQMFKPPREDEANEYRPWTPRKPGFTPFKKRKRVSK